MPIRLLNKIIPHPQTVKNLKSLRVIQHLLNNPNLWLLNRKSVPKAFAIGMFCAFLPIPCQMILAALLAIAWQANLSIAVFSVWLNNPLTIGPIFYAAYKLGSYILNTPEFIFNSNWSFSGIFNQLLVIGKPLWLGCIIMSITAACLSYYLMKLFWYLFLVYKIRTRAQRIL